MLAGLNFTEGIDSTINKTFSWIGTFTQLENHYYFFAQMNDTD